MPRLERERKAETFLRYTSAAHLLAKGLPITYRSAQIERADATATLR